MCKSIFSIIPSGAGDSLKKQPFSSSSFFFNPTPILSHIAIFHAHACPSIWLPNGSLPFMEYRRGVVTALQHV